MSVLLWKHTHKSCLTIELELKKTASVDFFKTDREVIVQSLYHFGGIFC